MLFLPLNKASFHSFSKYLSPIHSRMHLFVLVEIERVIIEEKIFIKSSVYFHHVNVISRWKRVFPSVKTYIKAFCLKMLCGKFSRNQTNGSREEGENVKSYRQVDGWTDKYWIPPTQGCFVPCLVDISWGVLQKKMKMWTFKSLMTPTMFNRKISVRKA